MYSINSSHMVKRLSAVMMIIIPTTYWEKDIPMKQVLKKSFSLFQDSTIVLILILVMFRPFFLKPWTNNQPSYLSRVTLIHPPGLLGRGLKGCTSFKGISWRRWRWPGAICAMSPPAPCSFGAYEPIDVLLP